MDATKPYWKVVVMYSSARVSGGAVCSILALGSNDEQTAERRVGILMREGMWYQQDSTTRIFIPPGQILCVEVTRVDPEPGGELGC